MTPKHFDEANANFGPPPDLEECQCRTIPAFQGEVEGGSCDRLRCVVVCYDVNQADIAVMQNTGKIFLTMIGGLAPHYLSLSFHDATHPT